MKNIRRPLKGLFYAIGLIAILLHIQTHTTQVHAQTPGAVDSSGYSIGVMDTMRMDAVDAEHINGDFINQFLDQYPNSRLRGYGHTIKRLADKYGLNVAAYLGQIAKETTFGSATCGGEYNFGCFMWADWMGVGKVGPSTGHTQYDRDWANPGSVEQGIEIQMQLVRDGYVNKGLAYYPVYLERYSPAFENDHSSFESLMYGVFQALGQPVNETRTKTPGGLANNIVLEVPVLKVERGSELTQEQLDELFTHEDIERSEWLTTESTQELGSKTVEVFIEFVDATVTRTLVQLEVIPKEVDIKVVDLDTGDVIAQDKAKETDTVSLELTDVIEQEEDYRITTDAKDVLTKLGTLQTTTTTQTEQPNVYQPQEQALASVDLSVQPSLVKRGRQVYIELEDFKDDTVVYVTKSIDPLAKVDEWLGNLNKTGGQYAQ